MTTVFIVVPCYNEEEVINETVRQLNAKLERLYKTKKISEQSKILLVDDGSRDKTWEKITGLMPQYERLEAIKLAHNKGHQNALLAGLLTAKEYCDCTISIDADLQDDIEVIDEFIEKYEQGCEVVYGVRKKRDKDSFFKKHSAQGFYKVMGILGVEIVYNHADYRLMSKKALEGLSEFKEVNLFLRGIIPSIGYKSDKVYYDRLERFAGESKYPLKKMIDFALEGISSCSVKPLKLISRGGIAISALSVFGLLYALISYLTGNAVDGWTAIVASIWLLGGLQMFCLGIVGTYIGKIYSEIKARPRFIIEKHLKSD